MGLVRLCLLALCALTIVTPAAAEVPISDNARARFKEGVKYVHSEDYRAAYEAFKAAYADSPSPKILGNVGLAAMKLERDGEAISAYERYLVESGAVNREEHKQINEDLQILKRRVVQVRLTIKPGQVLVTDERLAGNSVVASNVYDVGDGRLFIGVHGGKHRMTIEKPGHAAEVWLFDARSGLVATKTILLEPNAPPPATEPDTTDATTSTSAFPSTGFIVGASLSGALVIAAVVSGVVALSNKSEFDDAAGIDDVARAEELRDSGETLNLVTDILLGATVVAAAVTTVFLVIDLGNDQELALSPFGAGVRGAF